MILLASNCTDDDDDDDDEEPEEGAKGQRRLCFGWNKNLIVLAFCG